MLGGGRAFDLEPTFVRVTKGRRRALLFEEVASHVSIESTAVPLVVVGTVITSQ